MERGDDKKHQCNCKSGCDELSFTGEVSTSPLTTTIFQKEPQLINFSKDALAYVEFHILFISKLN